jgi:CRP-like cAMP-binding protein
MKLVGEILSKSIATQQEAEGIVQQFEKVLLKKNERLLNRHEICNFYFFLDKGLLRFSIERKDVDETAWIVFENSFFTDMFSVQSQLPSQFEIIAIENSTVYKIHKDKLNEIALIVSPFQEFLRRTMEMNLMRIAEVKLLHQFGDAKTRYDFFLRNQEMMKRVPQKLLASFIGITPYSLSRIRRKR